MIVLKHNGAVYIARSCWTLRDPAAIMGAPASPDNISMWHPSNRKNRLIAVDSNGRLTDLFRYERIFPKVLDMKSLAFGSYYFMRAIAERYDLFKETYFEADTVFAEKDKAFVIFGNGSVVEIEDFYTRTSNDEVAVTMYDTKGECDPYEFFRKVFKCIETTDRRIMFPLVVMSTKDNKIVRVEREG